MQNGSVVRRRKSTKIEAEMEERMGQTSNELENKVLPLNLYLQTILLVLLAFIYCVCRM